MRKFDRLFYITNPNYQNVIKDKFIKGKIKFDEKYVDELFEIIKNSDEKIENKLATYSEYFVIVYAEFIAKLLRLTEEQRKIILIESNYFNYDSDLDVLDVLNEMQDNFYKLVIRKSNELFNSIKFDNAKLSEIGFEIKQRKNMEFIGLILEEFLEMYPVINEYDILAKLFVELNQSIADIAFNHLNTLTINESRNRAHNEYECKVGAVIRMQKSCNHGKVKMPYKVTK